MVRHAVLVFAAALLLTDLMFLRPPGVWTAISVVGLEFLRPEPEEREEINRFIMEELTYAVLSPEALACHQRVISRMKDAGCDAVVLGCTEIPLLINDANAPLPTLDSTRLLARAALRHAIGDGRAPVPSH